MLGIIVDTVSDNSQTYVMFRELNKIVSTGTDCYLFANNVNSLPSIRNDFAILQQIESLSHKGTLIATSIINCQIVFNSLMAKEKYFYLLGPEWTNLKEFGSLQLKRLLYNRDIGLIARSDSYSKLIENLFQKPVGTVYNWNAEQLMRITNENR